ncbi:MAG: 1-phosphofructokinase [Oscillospiraceae bacterium]|nr:1-phosphofructokinase [Oscillospiraceae bacterium]
MIYTVTFNPAVDYALRVGEVKRGQVNRTVSDEVSFGGKGINVSTVLKTLGVESTALGFAAGFTGEALEKGLKKNGINAEFIHLDEGMTRICIKLYEEADGAETEINPAGPVIPKEKINELTSRLKALREGDTLVLAGSVPGSVSGDIYKQICKDLAGSGVRIAADASGDLLTGILPYRPFIVKPNHAEAGEICGIEATTPDHARECAAALREMGAQNAIVSMAEKGAALAAADGNVYFIAAPKGVAVNSVGAGDSMLAGFLAGFIATGDYRQSLLRGIAAGSATAFSKGLASREDYDRILKEISQ